MQKTSSLWHPCVIVVCLLAAVLIAALWQYQPVRDYWFDLDWSVYRGFGVFLTAHNLGDIFYITTLNIFETLSAIVLLLPFVYYVWAGGREHLHQRLAQAACMSICVNLSVLIVKHFFGDSLNALMTLHPLEAVAPVYSRMFLRPTFPSDHANMLFLVTIFTFFYAGWRIGLASFIVSFLLFIPRLNGVHWLSDAAIGTTLIVLIAAPLCLATPLHAKVEQFANKILTRFPWIESIAARVLFL